MIRFTMCPIAFWGNGTPSPGCPRYRAARVRLEERLRAFCSLNISMGLVCGLIARVLLHVARSSAQAALDGCRVVFFALAPRWTAFWKQCNKAVGHNCFCDIWRGTGCCSPASCAHAGPNVSFLSPWHVCLAFSSSRDGLCGGRPIPKAAFSSRRRTCGFILAQFVCR